MKVFPKGVKEPLLLTHVTGIGGKYGISCRQTEIEMLPLESPRKVTFFIIREKHSDMEFNVGYLTALSKNEAIFINSNTLKTRL